MELMESIGHCPKVNSKSGDIIKGNARELSVDKKEAGKLSPLFPMSTNSDPLMLLLRSLFDSHINFIYFY